MKAYSLIPTPTPCKDVSLRARPEITWNRGCNESEQFGVLLAVLGRDDPCVVEEAEANEERNGIRGGHSGRVSCRLARRALCGARLGEEAVPDGRLCSRQTPRAPSTCAREAAHLDRPPPLIWHLELRAHLLGMFVEAEAEQRYSVSFSGASTSGSRRSSARHRGCSRWHRVPLSQAAPRGRAVAFKHLLHLEECELVVGRLRESRRERTRRVAAARLFTVEAERDLETFPPLLPFSRAVGLSDGERCRRLPCRRRRARRRRLVQKVVERLEQVALAAPGVAVVASRAWQGTGVNTRPRSDRGGCGFRFRASVATRQAAAAREASGRTCGRSRWHSAVLRRRQPSRAAVQGRASPCRRKQPPC